MQPGRIQCSEVANMTALVILSIPAAFGILCVLWVCLGWLLPGQKGACTVCVCRGQEIDALLRRHRWLRDLGLLRYTLILVDEGMTEQQRKVLEGKHGIEICTREQLADRVG